MSSKQTVLVVDVPTVLSCLCLVGDPLLVLEIAGRGHKSLNWFRLEGDLGGGGNCTLTMPLDLATTSGL